LRLISGSNPATTPPLTVQTFFPLPCNNSPILPFARDPVSALHCPRIDIHLESEPLYSKLSDRPTNNDFPRIPLSILAKISSYLGDLLIWPISFHT
jgi:hypothetical protein